MPPGSSEKDPEGFWNRKGFQSYKSELCLRNGIQARCGSHGLVMPANLVRRMTRMSEVQGQEFKVNRIH